MAKPGSHASTCYELNPHSIVLTPTPYTVAVCGEEALTEVMKME